MKKYFTDMMGRKVEINTPPQRIISTVPSQTELLYDLGVGQEVIAITKFCVHPPEWFKNKTRIGGTKQLHIEKIKSLQPDLIIANKEENTQAAIEILAKDFPVWISDIQTIEDALQMIQQIGVLVNKEKQAKLLLHTIKAGLAGLPSLPVPIRTAYFIWYRPWMSVGSDSFIHDILQKIGLKNVFDDKKRYPEIEETTLIESDPELVLLSSEPYPFKEKHAAEIQKILPMSKVLLVDGEMFSWYGSRLQYAVPYLKQLVESIS